MSCLGSDAEDSDRGAEGRCILSCSHVFHADCIEAFERFNIYELLLCPMCRSPYQKASL